MQTIDKRTLTAVGVCAILVGVPSVCLGEEDLRGFKRIQITNTPNDGERSPSINDHGDIVFSRRIDQQEIKEELYVYSGGTITRLTTDQVHDSSADINNLGEIIWTRACGPNGRYGPTYEIAQLRDGGIELLTNNREDDRGCVNPEGRAVIWREQTAFGCRDSPITGIRRYENHQIEKTFDDGWSNQGIAANTRGTIVWTHYDFCPDPWESEILMLRDGEITRLVDGPQPQVPDIAPNDLIAWTNAGGLQLWQDDVVTWITDNGRNPSINSRGDIAFIRWTDDNDTWQAWFYIAGEFRMLAGDDHWNVVHDMNEWGDVVVSRSIPGKDHDIYLYHRLPDGDMNCDELVDFDDIDGFVAAITNRADYEQRYPDCDWWLADMSGNRSVDFDDIDGFIDCLVDGGCERQ